MSGSVIYLIKMKLSAGWAWGGGPMAKYFLKPEGVCGGGGLDMVHPQRLHCVRDTPLPCLAHPAVLTVGSCYHLVPRLTRLVCNGLEDTIVRLVPGTCESGPAMQCHYTSQADAPDVHGTMMISTLSS